MTIWLISPYGPIPGEGWRDYRYTMMGEALAAAGHDVVWWTPNFSHHFKRYRSIGWEDRAVRPRFRLRLVPTSGYSSNVSFARLRYEALFAWRTYRRALREPRPDCIVVTDPPQIVGRIGVWLARRRGCPLIFDVMDLWPELFALAIPAPLRPAAPLVFAPLLALRGRNYSHSSGLISLCNTYRDAALRQLRSAQAIPSATIFNGIDVARFRAAMQRPSHSDLPLKPKDELWAVYAGTLGANYDLPTLMKAAELLQCRASRVRTLVAGEGPLAPWLREFIRDRKIRNVTYLGSLPPRDLAPLYRQCDIGICAYGPSSNVAMPDKAYDYMAAGLPIVNSLQGELSELIATRGFGLPYRAGDAETLAGSLDRLATDDAMRAEMARRSFEAGAEFDQTIQYRQLPGLVECVSRCAHAAYS
jgi:glycosyltransferase involved in cell wall biosynthesis